MRDSQVNQYQVYTHAPSDWKINGVPYGALCKCSKCGLVGRSIITFDFFADEPQDPLVCETCVMGTPYPGELVRWLFDEQA